MRLSVDLSVWKKGGESSIVPARMQAFNIQHVYLLTRFDHNQRCCLIIINWASCIRHRAGVVLQVSAIACVVHNEAILLCVDLKIALQLPHLRSSGNSSSHFVVIHYYLLQSCSHLATAVARDEDK